MFQNIFAFIGSTGPFILMIVSVFLLRCKHIYLMFYLLGFIINIVFNCILKITIQDPRPKEDIILFELALNHGKRIAMDKYGMPSLHAQSVGYSYAFILFTIHNMYVVWGYLIISLITMMQRYAYKNHTFFQIVIGNIIGVIVGTLCYMLSNKCIQGKITQKEDDFCFV